MDQSSQKTLRLKPRASHQFLSQFKLESRSLTVGDASRGVAALRAGHDRDGNAVLIKTWERKKGVDDTDVRELWRNELRHLHRLSGQRGRSGHIAEIRDAVADEEGYHLVLNPGRRRPLNRFLDDEEDGGRAPRPTSTAGRRLIWENLLRIARGLDLLHSLGLLHRNLTPSSVLTAWDDEPDFQLTGFEWSMRLSTTDITSARRPPAYDGKHSFNKDWQQLGDLAARLLEIDEKKFRDTGIASHDVAAHLSAAEVHLVRQLTQIFLTDRIDGQTVEEQILSIVVALTAQEQNQEPAYHVVLPLGADGPLAIIIRIASGQSVEMDDVQAQQEFIENDLARPIAMSVRGRNTSDRAQLVLRGERLTYRLEDFDGIDRGRSARPESWDLAQCVSAREQAPPAGAIIKQIPLSGGALKFMRLIDARDEQYRLRGRITSWTVLRRQLSTVSDITPAEDRLLKSLVLTQMLEYLFAASDVFPVSVSVDEDNNDDLQETSRVRIVVSPRQAADRDELSKALELRKPPAARLIDALTDDLKVEEEETWILTDQARVGDRSDTATEWIFERERHLPSGEPVYIFSGDRPPYLSGPQFLVPGESAGRDAQLRRRMKSFTALAEHRELSRTLVDPSGRIQNSHENAVEDVGFVALDPSKQEAFRAIMETLALFLVQGPPGVGKTRLVAELVRQLLANDTSYRLLLSAQSNYAVDHLLKEVDRALKTAGISDALVVRCAPRDRERVAATRYDVSAQTASLLGGLLNSRLYAEASVQLKDRASDLALAYGISVPGKTLDPDAEPGRIARRSLEHLVLRSANLVFATTNSADLARLIEDRNQFDWAIVEEAAKATGAELISPLLLSPRRLMIGDHKQLPPFDANRIVDLFKRPDAVRAALRAGESLIGRTLRDRLVDDVFADVELMDTDRISSLCDEAIRNFSLFQSLIENEFERQKRNPHGRKIAAALQRQHRMHPAIAEIVSMTFYDGELLTDEARENEFIALPCPIVSSDTTRLPERPVVWVDMPWIQNTVGLKHGEQFPRFTNRDERSAVESILRLVRVRDDVTKAPTLALLSPYSRQVNALKHSVQSQGTGLRHLKRFQSGSTQEHFCNTVDSFQGSEADCAIISLVRNNHHGSIHSALGFLADPRRLNVLMSRAKWRLIVVGSLDFLRYVYGLAKSPEDRHAIEFLGCLLAAVDKGIADGNVARVPFNTLQRMKG